MQKIKLAFYVCPKVSFWAHVNIVYRNTAARQSHSHTRENVKT